MLPCSVLGEMNRVFWYLRIRTLGKDFPSGFPSPEIAFANFVFGNENGFERFVTCLFLDFQHCGIFLTADHLHYIPHGNLLSSCGLGGCSNGDRHFWHIRCCCKSEKVCLALPADALSLLPKGSIPIEPPAASVTGGHACRGFGIFALLVGRSRSGLHCEHR